MTVKDVAEKIGLTFLCGGENAEKRTVDGCYCGDLLSWVMSRADQNNLWLTVMGNINAVGVAVLAELSAIVLTENASLDADALKKAQENGVMILTTDKSTYETAALFAHLS